MEKLKPNQDPTLQGTILALWLTGHTQMEIAYGLDISLSTVKYWLKKSANEFPNLGKEREARNVRAV